MKLGSSPEDKYRLLFLFRVNYTVYHEEKGLPVMKEITKGEACDVGANYGVKVP